MTDQEREEEFAMKAKDAYEEAISLYFSDKANHPDFEILLRVIGREWKKVLEKPERVKRDANGNPVATILEKNGLPYFDLVSE